MIHIESSGVLYILSSQEILDSLSTDLLAEALRRGKAYRRSCQLRRRGQQALEPAIVKRDGMMGRYRVLED